MTVKPNSLHFTALAFLLISGILVSGCRKTTIHIYNFSLTGDTLTGHAIQFVPDKSIAGNSSFFWDFGDGSTSTLPSPTHTYQKYGSFFVSLMINNDTVHTIENYITIYKDPVYTSQLAGTWTFHYYYTNASPKPPYHTRYFIGDIALKITYINMVTILIGSDTFTYFNPNSPSSTIMFSHNFGSTLNYGVFSYDTMVHNMYYYHTWHVSAGSGEAKDEYYYP